MTDIKYNFFVAFRFIGTGYFEKQILHGSLVLSFDTDAPTGTQIRKAIYNDLVEPRARDEQTIELRGFCPLTTMQAEALLQ